MAEPIHLVLIPALLCDADLYQGVVAKLGSQVEAQVVVSPKPDLASSVADILARAPARFVLGGTSYGGRLALEVALAAPYRVQALWIMGADAEAPDRERSLGLAGMIEGRLDDAIALLAGLVVLPQHRAARSSFEAMARRIGAADGAAEMRALAGAEDVSARLGSLPMPVLVLWGQDDALVPVARGRHLADALPHAHFHTLAGCGHLPTLEKPDEVAGLVQGWLAELALAG